MKLQIIIFIVTVSCFFSKKVLNRNKQFPFPSFPNVQQDTFNFPHVQIVSSLQPPLIPPTPMPPVSKPVTFYRSPNPSHEVKVLKTQSTPSDLNAHFQKTISQSNYLLSPYKQPRASQLHSLLTKQFLLASYHADQIYSPFIAIGLRESTIIALAPAPIPVTT